MLKKLIFTSVHLIFWSVFIALSLQTAFNITDGWKFFKAYYPVYIVHLVWAAVAVYMTYFRLANFILQQRKPYRYLISSLAASPLISGFFFSVLYLGFQDIQEMLTLRLYTGSTITTFILIQLGTLIRAFEHWYNSQENKAEQEKINLQNELNLLRNQVNPHFLFNTLNNIDSLIRHDPKMASQAIIKLSDMMRYMLYETNTELVRLSQEKKYLEDLLDLHRLRHQSPDAIQFKHSILDGDRQIRPFLLLPFVENALKFASEKEGKPLVTVFLLDDGSALDFICTNYFDPHRQEKSVGGLGIENVKKRLEAYYPRRYELEIEKKSDLYRVRLNLKYHD
ncbi:MAG: histidine kinase [Bacteroidales bacterium]|nr:histidine kinase [Bacteroidales bacterium]